MTMWTLKGDVDEDAPGLPGIDARSKPRRSRGRGWREGLADQTVIPNLEDIRAYRAFERALIGSADPRSVIELELVHRLASLMWRLRRANSIETGLFEIQGELLLARRHDSSCKEPGALQTSPRTNGHGKAAGSNGAQEPPASDQEPVSPSMRPPLEPCSKPRTIAQRFLRLSKLDPALLDRVGSYEARLWRQAAQTIWTLDAMKRPPARRLRKPLPPFYWDAKQSMMR